jgi:hypothetical protein
MSIALLVIGIVVALLLVWVIIKIIKSCLPKIILGLIILAIAAVLIWYYAIR